jgi:hypothetical protein
MSEFAKKLAVAAPTPEKPQRGGPLSLCARVYDADLEDCTAIHAFRQRPTESWATAQRKWASRPGRSLSDLRRGTASSSTPGSTRTRWRLSNPSRSADGTHAAGGWRRHAHALLPPDVRRRNLRVDLDELVKAAKRRLNAQRLRHQSPTAPTSWRSVTCSSARLTATALRALCNGSSTPPSVQPTGTSKVAKGAPIYLAHLGDCIEGMVSQGGANTWRTTLTTTEQVRLYRRLLIEQVKAFAGPHRPSSSSAPSPATTTKHTGRSTPTATRGPSTPPPLYVTPSTSPAPTSTSPSTHPSATS